MLSAINYPQIVNMSTYYTTSNFGVLLESRDSTVHSFQVTEVQDALNRMC